MTFIILHRWPWADSAKHQKKILEPNGGLHFYLRIQKEALRARFCELLPHEHIPHVFLYGSPHLDNLIKTDTGCGLTDFDRALYGPYIADWMMLWLSIATFKQGWPDGSLIHSFIDGYTHAVMNQNTPYPIYQSLMNEPVSQETATAQAYIASQQKWIKKLRKQPLPSDDPLLLELLRQYGQSVGNMNFLQEYQVQEAGCGTGSLGRLHTIVILKSNLHDPKPLILDIKPALDYRQKTWPHGRYFYHDFTHEGARMIAASQLHAPMVTADEGMATLNGIDYWVRRLPHINLKISSIDTINESLLQSIGVQMGRSHGLGVRQPYKPLDILRHIENHQGAIFKAIEQLFYEMCEAHQHYKAFLA